MFENILSYALYLNRKQKSLMLKKGVDKNFYSCTIKLSPDNKRRKSDEIHEDDPCCTDACLRVPTSGGPRLLCRERTALDPDGCWRSPEYRRRAEPGGSNHGHHHRRRSDLYGLYPCRPDPSRTNLRRPALIERFGTKTRRLCGQHRRFFRFIP